MNRKVFITATLCCIVIFLLERYAFWYDTSFGQLMNGSQPWLRWAFFGSWLVACYQVGRVYMKDPSATLEAIDGFLLFFAVLLAVFAFFVYNVPMQVLEVVVRLFHGLQH